MCLLGRLAIAAAVDAYLAIYPAVVIWKLHMSIKKKVGLSLALGLGARCVSLYPE